MALADTGGAAGMVATLVSLYGRADVPGRIALDNWPGPRAGHRIYRLAPVAARPAPPVALPWPTLEPLLTLLLDTPPFFVMFWNSIGQSVAQVAGNLLVGAPAAWAISRLRFRGRSMVRGLYIVLMLLPFQVTMVPSYLILRQFGLLDTPWAIILPGIFSTFPVFIMERGFDTVPREVLESASIDGANQWQRFWRIGIPLGIPGLISALTLGFLDAWNAIEQPMTFLESPQYWPLSLFFTDPANLDTKQLGLAMAASLWMLLPSILAFRFGQTYLEAGLTKGAVKG